MNIKYFLPIGFTIMALGLFAQEQIPSTFQGRYHMLSPEELHYTGNRTKDFITTTPPVGSVRSIAEFERNQGVIISRSSSTGFGVPNALITSLSQEIMVYVIVSSTSWNTTVSNQLQTAGANMENITILNYPLDTYWSRDYSPWFIAYGEIPQIGIVDFPYNRPARTDDDEIPINLGGYFDLEVFGMDILHTGGNYMSDGLGVAASTTLVYTENPDLNQNEINQLAEDFLGISNYHLLADPLGDYIEHIDCWGKFLDVDKILIGQVAESDSRYDDYEATADYWANQTTSYGNTYQVFRVYSPNGQPYTNSLIMNERVFVPFVNGTGSEWNDEAQQVYQLAMPGYEIIGVPYNYWESTDALHCRTHEVPDLGMLYIKHTPYFDTIALADEYIVTAEITSYSGQNVVTESVRMYYRVNGANYSYLNMTNSNLNTWICSITGVNEDDVVDYYIEASDESGRTETHPFIGQSDPHHFVIGNTNVLPHLANKEHLSIYPNPAKDRISVVTDIENQTNVSCSIFDVYGKTVLQQQVHHNGGWQLNSIDISSFPPGIYYLIIKSDQISETKRFIIY